MWAYLFLAPALLFFAVFVIYPMLQALQYSLYYWPLGVPTKTFVGLDNYRRLILDDAVFRRSILNTVVFTIGTLVPAMALGLGLALILNQPLLRFRSLFRTIYFMPVISSLVAVGFVWRWLLEPSFGIVNYGLRLLSIKGPGWLASPNWALPGVMLMSVWRDLGFYMVIFLAGLQTIPREVHDAAMVDGATSWQRFWRVTLPLLNPTIVFSAVIGVINGLQLFTAVYVMTGGAVPPGGPLDSTRSAVLYIVDSAFRSQNIGYASAAASILFALILIFALLQIRLVERPFEY
jgi:multiple sugar transport system permease protein